ncbi:MAG TPA: hypothetical protein VNX22_04825, partial [Acidobacteriaceae bacterium]|nr:hypothetical protein [Acidobacteriaceae bacterium]
EESSLLNVAQDLRANHWRLQRDAGIETPPSNDFSLRSCEIGPGVYDIHSPRVPADGEIKDLLDKALEVLTPNQLWVNPDCGLKTRGWEEVELALTNMVETAAVLRASLKTRP